MENVLYNDLVRRRFDVDVGVVEIATMEGGKKSAKAVGSGFCGK